MCCVIIFCGNLATIGDLAVAIWSLTLPKIIVAVPGMSFFATNFINSPSLSTIFLAMNAVM